MRRKDRSGPGITNSDATWCGSFSGGTDAEMPSLTRGLGGGCSPLRANKGLARRDNNRTGRQTGHFTAGPLGANQVPRRPLDRSRKAGCFQLRDRNFPRSRLGEPEPQLPILMRKTYSNSLKVLRVFFDMEVTYRSRDRLLIEVKRLRLDRPSSELDRNREPRGLLLQKGSHHFQCIREFARGRRVRSVTVGPH